MTKIKFEKLSKGNVLGEAQYYKVVELTNDMATLITDSGETVRITKDYLENCTESAEQFDSTVKLTRTELAELFIRNAHKVMTVTFFKQVKEADVLTEVYRAYENSTPKELETALKKVIKVAMIGEERTIIGRHHGHVNEFGRVMFVDMMIEQNSTKPEYDSRLRQVDPRTIKMMILGNIQYVVK